MSALSAAGFVSAGLLAGALHFVLLHLNVALYVRRDGLGAAIALHMLRLAAAALLLLGVARFGALPLLLAAFGVVVARPVVVRCLAGGA